MSKIPIFWRRALVSLHLRQFCYVNEKLCLLDLRDATCQTQQLNIVELFSAVLCETAVIRMHVQMGNTIVHACYKFVKCVFCEESLLTEM